MDEAVMLQQPCAAGRYAYCGGRWTEVCEDPVRHVIGSRGAPFAIFLCDDHFAEAAILGLVSEPNISIEEFRRGLGGSN